MIITSLLDNDFYKFTMMQAVLHQYPEADVEYSFNCRTSGIDFSSIAAALDRELDSLSTLKFSKDELEYLRCIPFFKKDFIDILSLFQFKREHVIPEINSDGTLDIKVKGSWLLTILFEVPILTIVNEIYFRNMVPDPDYEGAREFLGRKVRIIKKNSNIFRFADFGTRRRLSFRWHEEVIKNLKENLDPANFIGSSNVYFAKKFGIKPIGTMAHEWIMAGQAVGVKLQNSQKHMLQKWTDEYRGSLGIALTDTIGIDAFLRDFDLYFAKLYDGVRHDSGDPVEFGFKIIDHYHKLGINPLTKTIVFSNNLDFEKAEKLAREFNNKINVSFGIGTNLTNDFPGVTPLSIVIKMNRCNGFPVAKISDDTDKITCNDPAYLEYLKSVFNKYA